MNKIINAISEMITYHITGVDGDSSMNIYEFLEYFPTYIRVEKIVTNVTWLLIAGIALTAVIVMIKTIKNRNVVLQGEES